MPSKSIAQQRLMGMALAYKRGELKNASDEVKKVADSMSEKELEKYASTKHTELPEKIKEDLIAESLNKMQKLMLIEDINGAITNTNKSFLDAVKDNIKSLLGIKENDLEEVVYDEFTFGIKIPFDKINMDKHTKLLNVLNKYKQFVDFQINGDKNNITYNFKHKELEEGEVIIPTTDGTEKTASASEKMKAQQELKSDNVVKFVKK